MSSRFQMWLLVTCCAGLALLTYIGVRMWSSHVESVRTQPIAENPFADIAIRTATDALANRGLLSDPVEFAAEEYGAGWAVRATSTSTTDQELVIFINESGVVTDVKEALVTKEQALAIAKQAIQEQGEWNNDVTFEARHVGLRWRVTAWLRFAPGGDRIIWIDDQGNVTNYKRALS